ncbi:nuclear transport factor 2 family protein [Pedobacter sp. PAMC26386]|nr:nuclear transport factor 2 family protein [Pedobacter sp. PAMC26386]
MKANKIFMRIALVMILLFGFNYSHSQSKSNLEEAQKAITASNANYHQAFSKNDPSIFINSYAEDGCILAPNMATVCGRGEVAKFFTAGYNMGIRGGKLVTTKMYGDGIEYVTEEGYGQIFDKNGMLMDEAKYLVVWKKTKEGWKMYRDIFNSNPSAK